MRPLPALLLSGLLLAAVATGCSAGGNAASSASASSRIDTSTDAVQVTAQDWPTYHHDNTRTGVGVGIAPLGTLATAWTAKLDGAVYGQPLVIGDTIVAATENDTIYALASADGHVLWSRHLGTPQPRSALPCGDIDPLGITGTPAYDPATGLVFAVDETDGGGHALYGVDLRTGAVALTRPITLPGGPGLDHQQRTALTVLNGWVYAGFGGLYGDCGQYVGTVVGAPTTGLAPLRMYSVPTTREAGIWEPGGAVLANGNLFYSVGNGASTSDSNYDHSDSVLALTPQLKLADSFSPTQWATDNAQDLDISSSGPAVVGKYIYIQGKRGIGYVLNASHLGGIGGQIGQVQVCAAYGGDSVDGDTVYSPCHDGTRAVTISATGQPTVKWTSAVKAGGSPVVGGGAVWTVDLNAGVLYALNPATGTTLASLPIGAVPHFASPTLDGSHAYVGTNSGVVAVSGV